MPRLHRGEVTNPLSNPGSERDTKLRHKTRKPGGQAELCSDTPPSPILTITRSPCPLRPRRPPPPEAAPPSPNGLCLQRDAAASVHPAASGSAQAGDPSSLLRVSASTTSRPHDSLYHTPRGATAEVVPPNDCAFHQPSDVNFPRSMPKVELYQGVARSWQHGGEQIGIACFE